MKGVNLLHVIYNKESRRTMSFRGFFSTLSMNNNNSNNSNRKKYIYITNSSLSLFLTAVEGPSHSTCQLGFQVFILLARRQIKGIMDRTEPGFC